MMLAGLGMGALGGIAGGIFGSSAAKAQIQQMREAIAYQKQKDAQTRADLTPYRDFGSKQVAGLDKWMDSPESDPMSFLDPGYQFRADQGMKGITGNAATAGMLQSGDTLRGMEQYGQDLASSEYGNAFSRRMQEGDFRKGLAQVGETAALGGGQLANQGAQNVGQLTADTDWGAPQKVWGDVVSGIGGMAGNAFSSGMARRPPTPGGSNAFAKDPLSMPYFGR